MAGKKVPAKDAAAEPPKFYAVARGSFTGIFTDWDTASSAIKGWKGPKYKKFPSRAEAVEYIRQWGDAKAVEGIGESVVEEEDDEDEEDEVELDDGILTEKVVERPAVVPGAKSKRPVLEIYTDGSALKNGGPGAKAGVGVFFGHNDSR